MACEEIINLIQEANALGAKEELTKTLYERAGFALRDMVSESAGRSFRDQNACPDHVILGEAEKSPEQKAFQALFDKILKKHGVDSPNELEDSKKDDFFNEVEREWKKDPANTPEKNESTTISEAGHLFDFDGIPLEYQQEYYRKIIDWFRDQLKPRPNVPAPPPPAPGPGEYHHGPSWKGRYPSRQNTPGGPMN